MGKVVADITMSLDGFVTASGANVNHGLGKGGERLHAWVEASEHSPLDAAVLNSAFQATGAVIMGRKTYETVDGPHGWQGETGYGWKQDQSKAPPCFVVTHNSPAHTRLQNLFTFVTDGIESAVTQARAAAGERDVFIMGGATVIQQGIHAGLVDELFIHVSPILLGSGTRLFNESDTALIQLEQLKVIETPHAIHLFYRIGETL